MHFSGITIFGCWETNTPQSRACPSTSIVCTAIYASSTKPYVNLLPAFALHYIEGIMTLLYYVSKTLCQLAHLRPHYLYNHEHRYTSFSPLLYAECSCSPRIIWEKISSAAAGRNAAYNLSVTTSVSEASTYHFVTSTIDPPVGM